ncbi:MAG: hypothetical protein KBT87_04785 [Gammaproteobacteria bacterium]|jgi:hypothetical protein|nr:hypothetical protein [Gammaproteobacteria bacterium]MBQ0773969.1 hypothetical protein [Gammaproteobacteria bacterium]
MTFSGGNLVGMGLFLGALALVSGCDNGPDTKQTNQDAEVASAVDEVARVSGQSADEQLDCGKLSYLLSALPSAVKIDGLEEVYRGCESPMTANLQFEDDEKAVYYTISVLQTEMADLPGQGDHWQGLLDMNRQAIESLIRTQEAMIEVGNKPVTSGAADPLTESERARLPRQVTLPNGANAMIYNEDEDWALVSLMKDRYALRIDLLSYADMAPDSDAAEAALMSKVAEINFAVLK